MSEVIIWFGKIQSLYSIEAFLVNTGVRLKPACVVLAS